MLSTLHSCVSFLNRILVILHMDRFHSTVFKRLLEVRETGKEAAFVVYYDYIRAGSKMRISANDDPDYLRSTIRSSVNDGKVYRGFNKKEMRRKQRIAAGIKRCMLDILFIFSIFDKL